MSYGRGQGGFPSESTTPGRRVPGGKGGGGLVMLVIIGAIAFFMFGGFGQGAKQQGQPDPKQQDGGLNENTWRHEQDERQADRDRKDQFEFDGKKENEKPQNDRVENRDGWSMEDADGKEKKKKNEFNFSNEKKEPASDAVKNKDGWSMEDADKKGGGSNVPLSNKSGPSKAKSDKVEKDGWKIKDATGKGSGGN